MNVETHLCVTLDDNGDIAAAYHTMEEAERAVESDDYYHEHEIGMVVDVPLMEGNNAE